VLVLAPHPPAAYVASGGARVPLAISSWCWDAHCGAPLGTTRRRVTFARGAPVRLELALAPVSATVSVAGSAARATVHGREISWRATRSGGITALVRYKRGWVIYTARLTVR
jgi:hypothetical protein